jgi:hypothetical protein
MVEKNNSESEEVFIIPEFGPCGGGESDEEPTENSNTKNTSEGCGKVNCCKEEQKEEKKKVMTEKVCYKCKEVRA